MRSAARPAGAHLTKMAGAFPTNPFHMDDLQGLAGSGAPETAESIPFCEQDGKVGPRGGYLADCSPNAHSRPLTPGNPNGGKPETTDALLSNLNSVYFREANAPSTPKLALAAGAGTPTVKNECVACVAFELEKLPSDGELLINLVSRLEHLKACSEAASRGLSCRVTERREELTKSASVLGELRSSLESLRREAAAVRSGLAKFRREYLLPSLEITKQQQAKQLLQQEMQQLLQIQKVEAILMAAENSCVNRQLPLQAALLVEGVALSFSRGAPSPSEQAGAAQQKDLKVPIHTGIKKMHRMLECLKADLNVALQAAARSLPPPPCRCGWHQPELLLSGSSQPASRRGRAASGAAASAALGPGEDTWPLYYSALAAFALLPPSSPVGSAISAAVVAAAESATRQVLCAFVPADAAAFSEAEPDGLEAQRACARLLLCPEPQHPAAAASVAAGVSSAKNLAASIDAADAAACFLTLLGVQYDFLVGSSALMRWHATEALRLLANVQAERASRQNGDPSSPSSENELLGLLGYKKALCMQARSKSAAAASCPEFICTYELAAAATQRLRGLPSGLRMALFLLQVRKQFLSQRASLWQQLQQQTADILQQLDLNSGGPTAVSDCLSIMHAVKVFVTIGDAFVSAQDAAAESHLAARAAAAAAAVAATDNASPAAVSFQPSGAAANGDFTAAAAVAADAAAAAAAAMAAAPESSEADMQCMHSSQSTGCLAQVLLTRVQAAIDSLHEIHTQELLEHMRAEKWQRLPVLRRFPLVLLRTPAPVTAMQLLPECINPSVVATESSSSSGGTAKAGGTRVNVCSNCGEPIVTSAVPNPFARWQPGRPFAETASQPVHKEHGEAAAIELAAIEEELRAAEACGRRSDEPPVAVAASQATARAFLQYWQLAVFTPEVAATAVRAMVRLMGLYIAAVAASALPEEICACLAALPMEEPPLYGEMSNRSRVTAHADAAVLRCRLPHLHWLLSQTDRDLQSFRKKILRDGGGEGSGSTNASASSRSHGPLLCELVRPMARLASPGALWGLAERVAAVESARDLLEALAQQLHLQGLPQNFGNKGETCGPQAQQQCQRLTSRGASAGLLRKLPSEEQQQLWRLLAATRCGVEDLRALVYRVAAASLCQSSSFLASFQQAGAESGTDWSAAAAAAGAAKECGHFGPAGKTRASDAIPRAYAAAVQQQRRQVADLFWRIRCAGSGSIPADVQLFVWRSVRSQTVADSIDALSAVPVAADLGEQCLNPGPLVAVAEALREIIAEAEVQYGKAAASAGFASAGARASHCVSVFCSDLPATADQICIAEGSESAAVSSPLDLSEGDFDCFLDVCSRTAAEVVQWCQEQRKSAFGFQGDGSGKTPPLRVLSQVLRRLENAGLLQKGQTAEFENSQNRTLMQPLQSPWLQS